MSIYIYICVYIYMKKHYIHTYIHIYIYIYVEGPLETQTRNIENMSLKSAWQHDDFDRVPHGLQ